MPVLTRALAAAVALAAVAACASQDSLPQHTVDPAALRAEVDGESGVITLPLDRFHLTEVEQQLLWQAQSIAFSRCVEAAGIQAPGSGSGEWGTISSRIFGVWFRPEVERYGYGLPVGGPTGSTADDQRVTLPPGMDEDEEFAVYDSCNSTAEVQRFESAEVQPGFDYAEAVDGLSDRALGSDEAAEVFAEWETCLAGHGLEVDRSVSPWSVRGTSLEPTEHNIRVALLDVGCKESTDYVQRLADIRAALQAPVVQQHLPELQEMRAELDAMLEDARGFLAENAP